MPSSQPPLAAPRELIDDIDNRILDLLQQRNRVVGDVIATKIRQSLPIFDAAREADKIVRFRAQAVERGLDAEWAEDFLRMIMGSSRDRQSHGDFPRAGSQPRDVLLVGGAGGMGSLYRRFLERSGHRVRVLDRDDWPRVAQLAAGIDLAIVAVPIDVTAEVICRLAPHLPADAVLADFTSNKNGLLELMRQVHPGPVLSLHPLHGPDAPNLAKQLMLACPGRDPQRSQWLLEQCRLWGMRIKIVEADQHDRVMHLVQGLRHFTTFLHGSFLRQCNLHPEDILDYSSPVYRMELMMTARMFAQDPQLYADIVLANAERRSLLLEFLEHHRALARIIEDNDREAFIMEFRHISMFFADFAERARRESGYLIYRLSERFA
ncbi:MAG: bifunctional chorismate mutase/prephenate dehydrogenase [Pseudomonadota bacterium]|jgi:chorismate mutase/prephenate dehydrogenase|nr:bifunctional chorismate mutase/prephenate dehydrogenase [Pseudomonadota bacterium]MDE3141722.1 bifunctional chorismate mutase/prephenate dehydrogenase [Pseudomonadota bacterium]